MSINILQNRNYSIEERLSILKKFYSDLNVEEIEDMLEKYEVKNEQSSFIELEKNSYELIKSSLENLCSDKFIELIKSQRFLEIIYKYKEKLVEYNYSDKSIYDICNGIDAVDYIIENYIVNYFFTKIMPFNNLESIEISIENLVKHYRIIKAYILGVCNGNSIEKNEVVKVIQCFSRCIEHNLEAGEYINKYI